jgi:isocitrate dehydrogenase kinase/phosphatase
VNWGELRLRANFQIQVLSSLFFRNKGAYLVGKIINGFTETPLALPILHNERPASWSSTRRCSARTTC